MNAVPPSDLSPEMQLAAVSAAIDENGMTIEEVKKQFPGMRQGIELYEKKKAKPPSRVGRGSREPLVLSQGPSLDI